MTRPPLRLMAQWFPRIPRCGSRGTPVWFALALQLLCGPAGALQTYDAEYQLLFNDELVARTLFRLNRDEGGHYTFEAYTIPDGKMATENAEHEILEGSEGTGRDGPVVPTSYFYSVREAAGTQLLEQVFDWNAAKLHIQSGEAAESTPLAADTQDRLSYLLRLVQAVAHGEDDLSFAVAEPERTLSMRFRRHARERLTVPAGTVDAIGVACFTDGDTPDRIIWIAPEWDHVPVLIERAAPDGRIRMELVQRHGGPLAP